MGAGPIDILYRAAGSRLFQRYYDENGWSGDVDLTDPAGDGVHGAPAIASAGRLNLTVIFRAEQIYYRSLEYR